MIDAMAKKVTSCSFTTGLGLLIVLSEGCALGSGEIHVMQPSRYGRPNPEAPSELSQFGFLIGNWRCDIRVKGPEGAWEEHRATWTARYILDGYVIADEYRETAADGRVVRYGATYRSYDAQHDAWVMKWHNALNSSWLDLAPAELGGVEVGEGSISFKHPVRGDALFRCTFTDISEDRFRWLGALSEDGGKTWEEMMVIDARRVRSFEEGER